MTVDSYFIFTEKTGLVKDCFATPAILVTGHMSDQWDPGSEVRVPYALFDKVRGCDCPNPCRAIVLSMGYIGLFAMA